MSRTVEEVVEKYVALRQQKRDIERTHEEELKPYSEKLGKMEIWLLAKMQEIGVENFKTKNGTAYKSVKSSCQMADSNVFKSFILKPVSDWLKAAFGVECDIETLLTIPKWDLVDFRALKSGVELYIEDNSQIPPGLTVTQTTTVNVRSK